MAASVGGILCSRLRFESRLQHPSPPIGVLAPSFPKAQFGAARLAQDLLPEVRKGASFSSLLLVFPSYSPLSLFPRHFFPAALGSVSHVHASSHTRRR